MLYESITICPICNNKLNIKKLQCSKCRTVIENDFRFSKFQYLTNEQLKFIEVFIKSRGNIKDVEKELGISYPTVRSKLDEVIGSLGGQKVKEPSKVKSTKEIIESLEKGEISSEEAVENLKNKEE